MAERNSIKQFFHCRKCTEECPPGQSMKHWSRIECGWTEKGWQIWCVRHDSNILSLDLKGQKISVAVDDGQPVLH